MTLTELSIKRPSLIIVIFTILIGGGMLAYSKLSYELLPKFSEPIITIATAYPGASPSEVEQQVTKKIEEAATNLENVKDITSTSMESYSLVVVNFKYGTDLDLTIQQAQRSINNVRADMPKEVKTSNISKVAMSDMPILTLLATSDLPDREFRQRMKDEILPQMQQIKGVATIDLVGGETREIRIDVNQNQLKYYGLSLLQISQAIGQANLEFPTGKVKQANEQMTVRLAGKFQSIEDLQNLVIKTENNSPIYLKNVANITDGIAETASICRYNGKNGLGIFLKKQSDANTVEISQLVREKLSEVEKNYTTQNVKFIISDDSSIFTLNAVDAVTHDLEIAIALVAVVMLLFLHSLRNALIVLVAIPASLISTFIAMYFLGYTLNLMTLLGMSLVIGILVDDSIVVLENIYRHLEMGKNARQAALDGRNEIGFTALSITMVDVVVFLPITFVESVISDVLRQYAVVVVVSTLLSLFVCFTITPLLASRFAKLTHLNPKNPLQWILIQFEKFITGFTNLYANLVAWFLGHKIIGFVWIASFFVATGWMMGLGIMGEEFFKEGDDHKFLLKLEYDNKTNLQANNLITKQIEDILVQKDEINFISTNIGGASFTGSLGAGSAYKSEIIVGTEKTFAMPTYIYMMGVKKEIEQKFAGVKTSVLVLGMAASTNPIEIILGGNDYNKVMATAQVLKTLVENVNGTNNVKLSSEGGNPEIKIDIDRKKMADLGLSLDLVGGTLQNGFTGNNDSKFRENGTEYDIRVMLDAFDRKNIDDVRNISFTNNIGQQVKLSEFANITESKGFSVLERRNRKTSVTLSCGVLGAGSGTVAAGIQKAIDENPLPADISMAWGGDIKNQNESFGALGIALLISIISVYLIMVALYDNFIYPFVVLFSIPVALIGALLALNLTLNNMGIFTMLGMIMLLGLVAKNAILLVDFTNQAKAEGMKTDEALVKAVQERMRPILMTTLAMVIGMLPIATATGAGAEWKNGLAWVLVGGLSSSMFLTIVLVPLMYSSVDWVKDKVQGWGGKGKEELVAEV